jgi:hypothetical protein
LIDPNISSQVCVYSCSRPITTLLLLSTDWALILLLVYERGTSLCRINIGFVQDPYHYLIARPSTRLRCHCWNMREEILWVGSAYWTKSNHDFWHHTTSSIKFLWRDKKIQLFFFVKVKAKFGNFIRSKNIFNLVFYKNQFFLPNVMIVFFFLGVLWIVKCR